MRGNGQMDLMFGGKAVGFAGAESFDDMKKNAAVEAHNKAVDAYTRALNENLKDELQKAQESKGKELTPEEQQQIEQQIEEELQAQTPDSVRKYMQREYQDPSEVMAQQLLQYLVQKCDIKRKFNTAFKHGLLSSRGIMYVGILNGEPEAWNVNSLRFNYERNFFRS